MKSEGKNRGKCVAYVAAFVVLQALVILVLALFVFKVNSPKVRFGMVRVDNFSNSTTNSSSFNMKLTAQVDVKNSNFGKFKYDNSTFTILYGDISVTQFTIPKGSAKMKSTKKFNVTVEIDSSEFSTNPSYGNDVNSGRLMLTSEGKLKGKVEIVKLMKKNKSGLMSCTMTLNLANPSVQDVKCK